MANIKKNFDTIKESETGVYECETTKIVTKRINLSNLHYEKIKLESRLEEITSILTEIEESKKAKADPV